MSLSQTKPNRIILEKSKQIHHKFRWLRALQFENIWKWSWDLKHVIIRLP
jgi:hypothetical protein